MNGAPCPQTQPTISPAHGEAALLADTTHPLTQKARQLESRLEKLMEEQKAALDMQAVVVDVVVGSRR